MDRRVFLRHSLAAATLSVAGLAEAQPAAAPPLIRVLIVLLRGGMDGLTAVPPIQDPRLAQIRPHIAVKSAVDLGNGFGLHPKLTHLHQLWRDQQLNIVHSTGFAYMGRSHFEGQDVMQSGIMKPYTSTSGWMGRALELAGQSHGVAISIPLPLVLKGRASSITEFPNWMPPADPQLMQQVRGLWQHDGELQSFAQRPLTPDAPMASGITRENYEALSSPAALATLAAARLRTPGGPRVAVIDMGSGFDTHGLQGGDEGMHASRLGVLDSIIEAFHTGMAEDWAHSLVLTVTEFGRTAAENGTYGTDHGVGTCCMIAGGLLQKSAVIADWRGLDPAQLYEGRDLPATIDTNAIFAQVVQRAFGLSNDQIQSHVLPFRAHPQLQIQWA